MRMMATYPSRETRTQAKLRSFSALPIGWHYGRGGPISDNVLDSAFNLYDNFLLLGLSRTDAFPDPDGGVLLTAYHGDHYIGVHVHVDESMSLVREFIDDEVERIENVPVRDIKRSLKKIAEEIIWATSGSFIPSSGTLIVGDSAMWLFGSHRAEDFPFSTSAALKPQAA